MPTMEWQIIEPAYRELFAQLRLTSCAGTLAQLAGAASPDRATVTVVPKSLRPSLGPAVEVFFKSYDYPGPTWRFWLRRSKARCEFANAAIFTRLEIPTAERVACGEQRDSLGRLRRAFIITRTISRARPLPQFLAEERPSHRVRTALVEQLAGMTRRIHEAHFYHHDLFWRNVLVTWEMPDDPKLWWIDCPRGGFVQLGRRHRQIKDLAALDKLAVTLCRPRERLAFLKHYLDIPRLDAATKDLARAIVTYRRQRWPDEPQ